MNKAFRSTLLLFMLLLGACTPQAPQVDMDQVGTIAAATVNAALAATKSAPLQPAATLTPAPTESAAPQATPTAEITAAAPPIENMDLKVAYTDGQGNLWFWQGGDNPQQITTSADVHDFALSPDGGLIFYSRSTAFVADSLWLIDTEGGDEREVMNAAAFEALDRPAQASGTAPTQLGWVPGSTTAVFTTYYYFDGPGFEPGNDLRLVNSASGAVSTLLAPGDGSGMYFYSLDGAQVALVTPNRIDLVNSDGSHRRNAVLSYGDIFMYTESPFYAQPVWAPDSSKLRVILLAPDRLGKPEEASSVWEIPTAGGNAVKVLDFHLNGLGSGASISPDLQRLVYFQNVSGGGKQDLHIASLDGGSDMVYASGSLNWGGWANDGQRFVWTDYAQVGSERKTFLGQAGQSPIQLGEPLAPYDLAWVAGDRFLFFTNDGGNPPAWLLYLGTVGGPNQLVAELPAGDGFPRFEFVK